MHETLRRSSLARGRARARRVNLELPLRADDRLGGHVVQGHVDGLGAIARRARGRLRPRRRRSRPPPELLRYVVEKGSIAVDGVSLTVAAVDDDDVPVSLIPETLERTTLGAAGAGRAGQPGGRRAGQVRREAAAVRAGRMSRTTPVRHHRGGDRGHPRRARWSSSATTRTARTRATSRSPPSSSRPRRSTSWPRRARGLICLALTPERCDELGLDLMAAKNESPFETAVHRLDRGARRRDDGHLGRRPRAHDPGRDRPREPRRATSSSPATSSR